MIKKIGILFLAVAGIGFSLQAQKYSIDVNKSVLKWDAKKMTGSGHFGTIQFKEGTLEMSGGKMTKAKILVDMTTVTNTDGPEGQPNGRLVTHLKSDDFFSVEKFETAEFVLTGSGTFENGNAKVYGRLSIKGLTQPINFEVKQEGNILTTQLKVDRTLFDIQYGSGKFFSDIGDRAINDEFDLDIKLVLNELK